MPFELRDNETGDALCIGKLPGRKRQALYRQNKDGIHPIAYFPKDADWLWMVKFLHAMFDTLNP